MVSAQVTARHSLTKASTNNYLTTIVCSAITMSEFPSLSGRLANGRHDGRSSAHGWLLLLDPAWRKRKHWNRWRSAPGDCHSPGGGIPIGTCRLRFQSIIQPGPWQRLCQAARRNNHSWVADPAPVWDFFTLKEGQAIALRIGGFHQ